MEELVELQKHETRVNEMLGKHGMWVCNSNYIVNGVESIADALQLTRSYQPHNYSIFVRIEYKGFEFIDILTKVGESNGTN